MYKKVNLNQYLKVLLYYTQNQNEAYRTFTSFISFTVFKIIITSFLPLNSSFKILPYNSPCSLSNHDLIFHYFCYMNTCPYMCLYIYIPNYNLLSLYNVIIMYVSKAKHLILVNQLLCFSFGKTMSSSFSINFSLFIFMHYICFYASSHMYTILSTNHN